MGTDTNQEKKPLSIETAARGEIVTVVVGPESVKYHVHKRTLIEHSDYFERALQGPWKEADEGVVRSEDIEPETFGIFVDWIYTQKLLLSPGREDATPGEEQSNYQIAMLKASIFSDRFLSPDFSTAVRHGFIHALNQSQKLYCRTVIYAYANLPPEDPLLRLLEDVYCHGCGFCHRDKDNDKLDDLPKTFLVNVMKALTEEQMHWVADSRTLNEYDYHNHTSAEEKAKCPWSS